MRRYSFLPCVILVVGCGATTATGPSIAAPRPTPSVVTDATYAEALRGYWAMTLESEGRRALRERLVSHLLAKDASAFDDDEYEGAVERLAQVSELYTPREIEEGLLPPGLAPTARYLVERGSPRGDEARVLSALLVLRGITPDDPAPAEKYKRIKAWGFDARSTLNAPLERFEEGLVEVWEEHARLTPTPEVLNTLARLYVARRNGLLALFQGGEQRMPLSDMVYEGVHDTALHLAAVYLVHGDINSALTHLQALNASGGVEERLIQILETASEEGGEGSSALLELARAYLGQQRSDVARGVCVLGLRSDPEDARFSRCLAHVAAKDGDFAGAMAWYTEAVRLTPEERGLYDEILEVLSGLMARGLFGDDAGQTRVIASRAAEILKERMRRWPDSPPAVRAEELYLAMAIAEMNAGNSAEAEARLKDSLAAKTTQAALLQLGLLLERTGRAREAVAPYQKALELSGAGGEAALRRAEILERLGDSQRMVGFTDDASKAYQQSLKLWEEHLSRQGAQRVGLAHLRRGVLLGRLARHAESTAAFQLAMEHAPDARETYATILAYLAVGQPDIALAHQVFRNAMNQLSLEPEWKVYFAFWLRMVAARAGSSVDGDENLVFDDLAEGQGWWAKLAQFGAGKLSFEGLVAGAVTLGERTEACFYEGVRRLSTGDRAGAREMFDRVLQSQMINFYEFAMAQQLLGQVGP